MSSKRTPEYKALSNNFHSICDSLSRQPATITPIANDLASDEVKIISEHTQNAVLYTKGNTPYELASTLMTNAQLTIQYEPDKFYLLVDKLESHGHGQIAKELTTLCSRINPQDTQPVTGISLQTGNEFVDHDSDNGPMELASQHVLQNSTSNESPPLPANDVVSVHKQILQEEELIAIVLDEIINGLSEKDSVSNDEVMRELSQTEP